MHVVGENQIDESKMRNDFRARKLLFYLFTIDPLKLLLY